MIPTVSGSLSKHAGPGLIVGIAALALGIRLVKLFSHPNIPDEAFTIYVGSLPLRQLFAMLRLHDAHPPLIYLIVHALLKVSHRAYTFRLITVAFGVMGTVATYFLARRFLERFAWLPPALVAVSPLLVFFDQYVRMYALLWSLSALSWALLLRAVEVPDRKWRWVAYALVAAALLYTHYLSFFVLSAQLLFVAARHRRCTGFWLALGAVGLCFIPWLPSFSEQLKFAGTTFSPASQYGARLFTLPATLLFNGIDPAIGSTAIAVSLWLLLLGGVAACVKARRSILWLLLPLVLQAAYSAASGKALIVPRYLLQDLPMLAICIASLLESLATTRAGMAAALIPVPLVCLMLNATADTLFVPAFQPVDWAAYARFFSDHLRPGDGVIFNNGIAYFALQGTVPLRGHPLFLVTDSSTVRQVSAQASRLSHVWYVGYEAELSDPQHSVATALAQSHPKSRSWRSEQANEGEAVYTTLFQR